MFCPRCRAEYRTGFTRCNDCNVALVWRLDPESGFVIDESDKSPYVVVATTQNPFEEAQIRSFLEAAGIPVEVQGEAFRKVYGVNIGGVGAAHILVPRELAEDAFELLSNAESGRFTIEPES